jgi:Tfp pilus assembly protein PilX
MKLFSHSQRGLTLLVVLVMLVMITLFVLSMVRLSSTNLKVIGNMQAQRALESSAQQAIETYISTSTFFEDTATNTGLWAAGVNSVDVVVNGYTVTTNRPTCIYSAPASGYSAISGISPEDTNWEVAANSSDSFTSAQTSIVQGVKIRLPAGNCP